MCKLFGYIQNHEISALKRIFGLSDPETFLIDLYEKPSFTLKILFARSVLGSSSWTTTSFIRWSYHWYTKQLFNPYCFPDHMEHREWKTKWHIYISTSTSAPDSSKIHATTLNPCKFTLHIQKRKQYVSALPNCYLVSLAFIQYLSIHPIAVCCAK